MLVYPSGALGSRWRRLNAGRQTLLTLAHLRNGQPYAQLAAGFGIGTTTTAYRYITEAVNLLAALGPHPQVPSSCRYASSGPFSVLNCHMRLRTSLRCIESILTSDHRAWIASVSASRSMRHPPALSIRGWVVGVPGGV